MFRRGLKNIVILTNESTSNITRLNRIDQSQGLEFQRTKKDIQNNRNSDKKKREKEIKRQKDQKTKSQRKKKAKEKEDGKERQIDKEIQRKRDKETNILGYKEIKK